MGTTGILSFRQECSRHTFRNLLVSVNREAPSWTPHRSLIFSIPHNIFALQQGTCIPRRVERRSLPGRSEYKLWGRGFKRHREEMQAGEVTWGLLRIWGSNSGSDLRRLGFRLQCYVCSISGKRTWGLVVLRPQVLFSCVMTALSQSPCILQ